MKISNGMNFLNKLTFLLNKPKVILVTGNARQSTREAIFQVLKSHFKIGKKILLFETDLKINQQLDFFIKNSSLSILAVTHIGDIPSDNDFLTGEIEETIEIRKIAKILPTNGYLILNFDDETVRGIQSESQAHALTFGLQEGADFRASDITLNGRDASSAPEGGEPVLGVNFKINYKGNIVPIWLEKVSDKEQIYAALAGAVCGTILGLNLVEISQALKLYNLSKEVK